VDRKLRGIEHEASSPDAAQRVSGALLIRGRQAMLPLEWSRFCDAA
jgi:hypothetical protein